MLYETNLKMSSKFLNDSKAMTIFDYITKFRRKSHIDIGDSLISVHTNDCSKVINVVDKTIIEFSTDEYCINAKNGFYLIANSKTNCFYIVNSQKEVVRNIEIDRISLLESRDFYVYGKEDSKSILVLDYSGQIIYDYTCESSYSFIEAHLISRYIISFEFYPNFDCCEFYNNDLHKSVVINIATKQILKEGTTTDYDEDETIICDVTSFKFPIYVRNDKVSDCFKEKEQIPPKFSIIKYTVVEPNFDDNGKVVYLRHIELCDYLGNLILKTDYSEILLLDNGMYLVRKNFADKSVYGILDEWFNVFLPCVFPELSIKNNSILIEGSNWTESEDCILDVSSKRFRMTKKNGETILLPYLYSSCHENERINGKILIGNRYDEFGRYCYGIIDSDGNEILPAIYKNLSYFSENLIVGYSHEEDSLYEVADKVQLIQLNNNTCTLLNKYVKIECDEYHNDFFRVRILDNTTYRKIKLGIVNNIGIEILPPIYDYVCFPIEDKICYIKNGVPGWYDLKDDSIHEYSRYSVIIPFKKEIFKFSTVPVVVKSESSYTEITGYDQETGSHNYSTFYTDDISGKVRLSFRLVNPTFGLMDIFGKVILDSNYTEIKCEYDLSELIFVQRNRLWGVVDCMGNFIIPTQYHWYSTDSDYFNAAFSNAAFCCVLEDSEVDYYDENAKLIGTEDIRTFRMRGSSDEYEDDYDYERDTFYALGGDDYDNFRRNGSSIDDMMDSLGY